MSGVVRTVGRIAGAVAPIVGLFNPVIGAALAAVSVVSSVVAGNGPPPAARGNVSNVIIQENAPTPIGFGRSFIGGSLVFEEGYGPVVDDVPNPYLAQTYIYSNGPVDAIEGVYSDYTLINFSGNNAIGYYNNFMFRDLQTGLKPESNALALRYTGASRWNSSSGLSGYAAALFNLRFDREGERFATNRPSLGVIGRWNKCYDPRKDSTYIGGNGSHRIDDPSTHEWTQNPAIAALQYVYGFYTNGLLDVGVGLPLDAIILDQYVSLANVCDANNWKVNGHIFEPNNRYPNLKDILICAGAIPVWINGRLGVKYDAPRVSIDTVTMDDIADGDISVQDGADWASRINTITPRYRQSNGQWPYVDGSSVSVQEYIDQDGEIKEDGVQYNMVTDENQAAQLAAYMLVNARELGPITLTLKSRFRFYSVGDVLTLDLKDIDDRLDNIDCMIESRTFDPSTMNSIFTLKSETAEKHDFALGRTDTPPSPISLPTGEEFDNVARLNRFIDESTSSSFLHNRVIIPDIEAAAGTAQWGGVKSRPIELTDGRVSSGLTSVGDVARNVPQNRAGHIVAAGFTGQGNLSVKNEIDLNLALGQTWKRQVYGPAHLIEGSKVEAISSNSTWVNRTVGETFRNSAYTQFRLSADGNRGMAGLCFDPERTSGNGFFNAVFFTNIAIGNGNIQYYNSDGTLIFNQAFSDLSENDLFSFFFKDSVVRVYINNILRATISINEPLCAPFFSSLHVGAAAFDMRCGSYDASIEANVRGMTIDGLIAQNVPQNRAGHIVSAGFTGQGSLATQNGIDAASNFLFGLLPEAKAATSLRNSELGPSITAASNTAVWGNVSSRPVELTDNRITNGLTNTGLVAQNIPQNRGGHLIATGIAGQGSLATQNNVAWNNQVINRPAELTDGRVAAGFASNGDVARNVPQNRAGHIVAAGFTGQGNLSVKNEIDLNLTLGQTWKRQVYGPTHLIEGSSISALVNSSWDNRTVGEVYRNSAYMQFRVLKSNARCVVGFCSNPSLSSGTSFLNACFFTNINANSMRAGNYISDTTPQELSTGDYQNSDIFSLFWSGGTIRMYRNNQLIRIVVYTGDLVAPVFGSFHAGAASFDMRCGSYDASVEANVLGITKDGDVARNVPQNRAGHIVAAAYAGQTAWGTYTGSINRISKFSDDGRVNDPRAYNTQALLGPRSTTNLVPTYTVGASNVTINLPAHTRLIAGMSGPQILSYGASSGVQPFSKLWYAYIDDPNLTGNASPSVIFTNNAQDLLFTNRYHIASGFTPAANNTGGTAGSGGGGGPSGPIRPPDESNGQFPSN